MDKKWEIAQKNELKSWIDTDINYDTLIKDWNNRMKQIGFNIEELDKTKNILDLGCGPVPILHILPNANLMVAADPLNEEYKNKFPRKNYIIYKTFMAEKIPYEDAIFDIIFCINALDHMANPEEAFKEMIRVLKHNGLLYLEFQNTSPLSKFLARLGYKKPLTEFHPHLISEEDIINILNNSYYNFKILMKKRRPQFSFKKIKYLLSLIFTRKKITKYEKVVSALSYGKSKFISHHIIIFIERLLYFIFPQKYSYFVNLVIQKI